MAVNETCARCAAKLEWHEQRMVFWNSQLKKGYIKWYVIGSREFGRRKEFPEYKGKKLCQICAHEVFTGEVFRKDDKKQNTQINLKSFETKDAEAIADFAALKGVLLENGVVMSTFNCQKCNNMVDIPETGKLLICKHCGAPIKPNEIFEKIKQLM
jgi:hypothetical protein